MRAISQHYQTPDKIGKASGSMVLSPLKDGGGVKSPFNGGTHGIQDLKSRVHNFIKRRELGWQQYVLPISKLNEEWHPSQKITFEKI